MQESITSQPSSLSSKNNGYFKVLFKFYSTLFLFKAKFKYPLEASSNVFKVLMKGFPRSMNSLIFMSKTTKSAGIQRFPKCTNTSSFIPCMYTIVLLLSCKLNEEGKNCELNLFEIFKGVRFESVSESTIIDNSQRFQ